MLQVSGILPLARDAPPWKYRLHQAYTALMTVIPYLYALQNLGHMYKVRHDAVQVMDSMFLLLSYINMIYKKMVLLLDADQVYELLHVMKGPLFNQDDAAHREILDNHAARALSSLKLFHYLALCSCFFWMAFPTFEHFRGYDLYFPLWMPIDPNKPVNFYIVMLYLFVQWEYHAVVQCTFDLFASYMLAQCTTQVYILRLDLESAVERSHEKARQENIILGVSFMCSQYSLYAIEHAEYQILQPMLRDVLPFFDERVFQATKCNWKWNSVSHTSAKLVPSMLNGIQIGAPCWPLNFVDSYVMKILIYNLSSVRPCIIVHEHGILAHIGQKRTTMFIEDLIDVSHSS
ncbi:unnamed protein product [Plutella xylostella]|uniref:Odorant receptor n=1 Tax=Plutella xylostella TaxID=51655 RepID=A0A8S4G7G4_PLUXY|nr:unnamed protein product [Plutella xylostella]